MPVQKNQTKSKAKGLLSHRSSRSRRSRSSSSSSSSGSGSSSGSVGGPTAGGGGQESAVRAAVSVLGGLEAGGVVREDVLAVLVSSGLSSARALKRATDANLASLGIKKGPRIHILKFASGLLPDADDELDEESTAHDAASAAAGTDSWGGSVLAGSSNEVSVAPGHSGGSGGGGCREGGAAPPVVPAAAHPSTKQLLKSKSQTTPSATNKKPCRHFSQTGACRQGDACPYLHSRTCKDNKQASSVHTTAAAAAATLTAAAAAPNKNPSKKTPNSPKQPAGSGAPLSKQVSKAVILDQVRAALGFAVDSPAGGKGRLNSSRAGEVVSANVPLFKALHKKLSTAVRSGEVPGFVWSADGVITRAPASPSSPPPSSATSSSSSSSSPSISSSAPPSTAAASKQTTVTKAGEKHPPGLNLASSPKSPPSAAPPIPQPPPPAATTTTRPLHTPSPQATPSLTPSPPPPQKAATATTTPPPPPPMSAKATSPLSNHTAAATVVAPNAADDSFIDSKVASLLRSWGVSDVDISALGAAGISSFEALAGASDSALEACGLRKGPRMKVRGWQRSEHARGSTEPT
mmetsp:Transcript_86572/g.167704  ORF Transcript_86572/g.167704 Transcript_86572/m.167704 type:complete len:577 (-) Transcript_86572:31-1761(-)